MYVTLVLLCFYTKQQNLLKGSLKTLTCGWTFIYIMVGAKDVFANCEGWLMVSQSKTTSFKKIKYLISKKYQL